MHTELLKSLYQKASALSPDLRDDLARQWLKQLEDEELWDKKMQNTSTVIDSLAELALGEYEARKNGKSQEKRASP